MLGETLTFPAAFAAGLLSFFSPCILPLIPAYFTFITGFSLEQLTTSPTALVRRRVVLSTLGFGAGFALVFILLGASASLIGGLALRYHGVLRIAGGILIILLGLHLMGVVRLRRLEVDRHLAIRRPVHLMGAVVVGMAFAAGWSPCIGPLLGSILILASSQETVGEGVVLLAVYSMGLFIPFLAMSLCIDLLLRFLIRARRLVQYVNRAAGALLVFLGLMLIANRLGWLWSQFVAAAG
jgi:cytochrome c-type biogenesis protein